jgi:hypothetical protein
MSGEADSVTWLRSPFPVLDFELHLFQAQYNRDKVSRRIAYVPLSVLDFIIG